MDAPNQLHHVLDRAVVRLLGPLFRVLLRHGMSFTAFEALAKRTFVEVAIREFGIPGKKPSISRVSILSGLTRKDVQRLLSEDEAGTRADSATERENRAARVLSAWTRDADYLDAAGEPRVLDLQDGPMSFAELVRRHSGDMPVRAVLDELVRVGAVRRREDGRVELVARVFLPRRSAVDKLELLGAEVSDLVTTIDHNIQHGDTDPRFQRKVMYMNIPAHVAPEFRKLSATLAMGALEKLDRFLAARGEEFSSLPELPGSRVRLGLGIYYFEESLDSTPDKED
jgi:Family of unknown function (DUF6502)